VAIVVLLQQLGRLVVQYHFPDDMAQIRRLMLSAPSEDPGGKEEPGMSEQSACFAVLGVDMESMASAVVRAWGLGEDVQVLMRRLPPEGTVHMPSSDEDYLRTLASCAHEITLARQLPSPLKVQAGLANVIKRYGRALDLTKKRLQEAMAEADSVGHADREGPGRSEDVREPVA
jgi:eukaryotic-like serine/threonine-protein kinase